MEACSRHRKPPHFRATGKQRADHDSDTSWSRPENRPPKDHDEGGGDFRRRIVRMKKTLLILNLALAVILSCGWLFPACWAAHRWLDWSLMSEAQRIEHLHQNSFPIPLFVKFFATLSAEWLGTAALYWSLRFSIPLFFQNGSDSPRWKKTGLRLPAKEASLSKAILEERKSSENR